MNVTKETAYQFYEFNSGTHNGEYCHIPNSPTLHAFLKPYTKEINLQVHAVTKMEFVEFLEGVIAQLTEFESR